MTEKETIQYRLQLLEYHRGAMEDRRRLNFRIFLGVVAMYLLLGGFMAELWSKPAPVLGLAVGLIEIVALSILVLFTVVCWQIENANIFDRDKYIQLHAVIWDDVMNEPYRYDPPVAPETRREIAWRAWTMTCPVIFSAILTVCLFVMGFAMTGMNAK